MTCLVDLIISFFRWELLEVPLDYEEQSLPDEPTLTLDGLTAGKYTVKVMKKCSTDK